MNPLLALIAGLSGGLGGYQQGRQIAWQRQQAQDERDREDKRQQAQLLFQRQKLTTDTMQGLPDLYEKLASQPGAVQTATLRGVRDGMPEDQRGNVYVPGEETVTEAPSNPTPRSGGLGGFNPFSQGVVNSSDDSVVANQNPFLSPTEKPMTVDEAITIAKTMAAQGGDGQPTLAAFLEQKFPQLKGKLGQFRNLSPFPDDAAKIAGTEQTRAQTDRITKLLPLEYQGLIGDNAYRKTQIIGQGLENQLKIPEFVYKKRNDAENRKTTERGQDLGAETARNGQAVTANGQILSAETTRRGQDKAAETAKNGQNNTLTSEEVKQGFERRKNAFAAIDGLTKDRAAAEKEAGEHYAILSSGVDPKTGNKLNEGQLEAIRQLHRAAIQRTRNISEDIKQRKAGLGLGDPSGAPAPLTINAGGKTMSLAQPPSFQRPRDNSGKFIRTPRTIQRKGGGSLIVQPIQ